MFLSHVYKLACVSIVSATLSGCYLTGNNRNVWDEKTDIGPDLNGFSQNQRRGKFDLANQSENDGSRNPEFQQIGSGAFVGTQINYDEAEAISGEPGVTMNLVNVSVTEAAETVLGKILGMNYLIDPSVAGKVTIQTTNPISKNALIDVFEAVLKTTNAVIIEENGLYKVVPSSGQGTGSNPNFTTGESNRPGQQTQIVSLENMTASEMGNILQMVSPSSSILFVDDVRNIMVVSGNRREISSLRETIKLFDVDWMRGMSVAIFPVRTANAEAIAEELDTIFGTKDGPLKDNVRFLPNRRLKSILVMSKHPKHIRRAEQWITKLDTFAGSSEQQMYVYRVQNRTAGELAKILQSVLGVSVDSVSSGSNADGVAPGLTPINLTSGGASQTGTDKSIRVVPDDPNSTLLILSTPAEYKRVYRILQELDAVPIQVMLETVIAEVQLNDELKFGVQWFLEKGASSGTFSNAVSGAVASSFPGFSYVLDASNIRVVLNALSSVTNVNVISSPSLMVLDNKTATLQVGDQVPVATQSSQASNDPNAPIINQIEFKDTGIILAVTPRVNDAGRVVLKINQEVSDVIQTTSSGIDSPTIQQRKIDTTVVINDGESFALGGLIQERKNLTQGKIPLLGDIPLIGNVFKNKTDTIRRTELIIFIRPSVVRDPHEARRVTEELREQMELDGLNRWNGDTRLQRDIDRLVN